MAIRICFAEDHEMFQEGIKFMLNKIDQFEVVGVFSNGQELVSGVLDLNPDVILTDIDMPLLDGLEATRILCKQNPNLKIIALSMYGDQKYYFEMINAGAKGFVLKQSSVTELEQAIKDVHNGKNFFSPELLHKVILNMQSNDVRGKEALSNKLELTKREKEILELICQGLSNNEIAEKLFLSVKTIETHKSNLLHKTNSKNNAGIIIWAIKNKMVEI